MSIIRLAACAQSAIEVDVLDGGDNGYDPESFAVLRACYSDGALSVPADTAEVWALHAALTEIANAHDDISRDRSADVDERRFARSACRALSTAASKVVATLVA